MKKLSVFDIPLALGIAVMTIKRMRLCYSRYICLMKTVNHYGHKLMNLKYGEIWKQKI